MGRTIPTRLHSLCCSVRINSVRVSPMIEATRAAEEVPSFNGNAFELLVYLVKIPGSELRLGQPRASDNRLFQNRIAGCYEQVGQ
jgi:hypothetical protein